DRVNLVIGNNGAGKSMFFEVLYNVVALAVRGSAVQDLFSPNTLTRWSSRNVQRLEVDLSLSSGSYTYMVEIEHDASKQTVTLSRETVKYRSATPMGRERVLFAYDDSTVRLHNNDGRSGEEFPFRGIRSFLPQLEARPENSLLKEFLQYLVNV